MAWGLLNYSGEAVDLDALLEWSRVAGAADAVAALPDEVEAHLGDWLEPGLGEQTQLVQSLWQAGHAGDMLAVGLVCSLRYQRGQQSSQEIFQARGRFSERFLGGTKIAVSALQAFGIAAVSHVERHLQHGAYGELNASFSYAEQVLASLDLMPLAVESDLLPVAFGLRMDRFAATLKRSIGGKSMPALLSALSAVQRHQLAKLRTDQVRRAELAVRTTSWLQTEEPGAVSAQAAIGDYIDNGGYLDWARSGIWSGDEREAVSQA